MIIQNLLIRCHVQCHLCRKGILQYKVDKKRDHMQKTLDRGVIFKGMITKHAVRLKGIDWYSRKLMI